MTSHSNNTEALWLTTLSTAQRQFWNWMIECDGKDRTTAHEYVNFVGECNAYVEKLLGIKVDFYALESLQQVAQLKELLYSNSEFRLHSAAFPTLKSALNKFVQYMEKKNNSKTHITTRNRKESFQEWMLANNYKETTVINYAYNVQKCSDFMTERIEKYDFYRAQSAEELNQKALRLLKDASFKDMDIARHAQCSNALKRYCEFMASL